MKLRIINLLVAVIVTAGLHAQKSADIPVPGYDDNRSLTGDEAIRFYTDLDER